MEKQPNGEEKEQTENYIGLTENEFKTRYANHKQSFNNETLKNATELSKYIWKLKRSNTDYKINWKIVGHAPAYTNTTKKCNLCNLEKYHIIINKKQASLNQRCGIITSCRHTYKFMLANHPT
jgi:hypothetical protein